jgi:hypothetical protein
MPTAHVTIAARAHLAGKKSAFGTTTKAVHLTATARLDLPASMARVHLTKAVILATPMVTAEQVMFVAMDAALGHTV